MNSYIHTFWRKMHWQFLTCLLFNCVFIRNTFGGQLQSCFIAHRNIQIVCGIPFERRSGLNEEECKDMCATEAPHCLSVQYDRYKQQCDLFDTSSPLDTPIPANEAVKAWKRLARSIDEPNEQEEPLEEKSADSEKAECLLSVIPSIGVVHYSINHTCLQEFSIPQTPSQRMKARDPVQKKIVATTSLMSDAGVINDPRNPFIPQIEVLPIIPDCSNEEIARVQIIDGVQVDSPATVGFVTDTADKCLHACKTNSFPDGSRLPLLCRSAHYDKLNHKCAVFPDQLNPNGFLQYKPNPQVIYMEKLCVAPSQMDAGCDEVFRRVPQHILIGHASDILTAASQQDCILHCINAHIERGFGCRSIVHYTEFSVANCILNFHTRVTRPEFFTVELRKQVDYVEVPTCAYKTPSVRKVHDGNSEGETLAKKALKSPVFKSPSELFVPESFINDGETNSLDNDLLNNSPTKKHGAYDLPIQFDPNRSLIALNTNTNSGSNKERSSPEWSAWSLCDPSTSTRSRSRECIECSERLQIQPCFAQSQFDTAVATFLKQNGAEVNEKALLDKTNVEANRRVLIPFPSREQLNSDKLLQSASLSSKKELEFFGPPAKVAGYSYRMF